MKNLVFILLFLAAAAVTFGQTIPTCNGTNGPNCTDYFGVPNWANSPLPAGTITGYTLVAGGSGYSTPIVTVNDITGAPLTFALGAADVTGGVITGMTGGTGGGNYTLPQVTIVDMGPGWLSGPATCDGTGQPPCGSGALATAIIGPPFTPGTGVRKFLDNLKSLPIAVPDTTTFPGSDYYVIGLTQFTQKMHTDLPPTTIRGYVQLNNGTPTAANPTGAPPAQSYLGPVIIAQKDRPVRVLFKNMLPIGLGGNLFIPTDTTYMGADKDGNGITYTQNRATLHLHGGATPWISDGTPHQWTVPAGEGGVQRGLSTAFVPDMWFDASGNVVPAGTPSASNDPGPGNMTFYWTNQQGGRLMFYHDHAYGITRLNVYAGEAAGYLLYDPTEEASLAAATAPGTITGSGADLAHLIPLVIQDKTFVPSAAQVGAQDPTWVGHFGATALSSLPGGNGDLWFPHVYMPNQNPFDITGASAFGHWDYGPWFFPPQTTLSAANPPSAVTVGCTSSAYPAQALQPGAACPTCGCPITPNPSGTPEGFMDTPVVNGVAYPVLHVSPAAYRFQILAAGNDRSWNLSWFLADPSGTEVGMVPAAPPSAGAALPLCTAINPVAVPSLGLGLATALLDGTGKPMNGTGLPANCWPNYGPLQGIPPAQTMWAADGRFGGAPDPRKAGPPWIQIGTEGGLLPSPVVIPATPVNYEQNVRSITIGSVAVHGLWVGPAERADVIVDFSNFAGKTLILYNDAPAPAPAGDSRVDYFTNDGDQTPIGGGPNTQPGYGPNIRTVMQVVVDGTGPNSVPNAVPFNLAALKAAFTSTASTPGLFAATQPKIVVPEKAYNSAYNGSFTDVYAGIQANNLTFAPIAPQSFDQPCSPGSTTCAVLDQKAIQELFTLDYGRMNATLGVELPLTNFQTQTTIPYGFVDWPTETIQQGQTQLWKITHNGVDTHFIHFHLFNVQVVNRVGWDGSMRPPDSNELGWKDTVRMNPLEDILVALQPITPTFPFPLPDSIRPMDVTAPVNVADPANISGLDPTSGNATVSNANTPINLGWEYVWHCHILGHEENDMMRPIIYQVPPPAPNTLNATPAVSPATGVVVSWTDNSASETGFTIQRDTTPAFSSATTFTAGPSAPAPPSTTAGTSYGATMTYNDTTATPGATYYYRVRAEDAFTPSAPYPNTAAYQQFIPQPLSSAWSNTASLTATLTTAAVTFTGAPATAAYNTTFTVMATTNASTMPAITATGVCSVGTVTGTTGNAAAVVTMTSGTGSCALTASWAADGTFQSATATQTTAASLATPTVSFSGAPSTAPNSATFTITATTNAGVAPVIAATPGVCTIGALTGTSPATALVTMTSGSGTCMLTASWSATPNYASSVAVQKTVASLAASTVTLSYTAGAPSGVYGSSFSVTATTNASVLPTITATSGPCSVGPVSGTAASGTATANVTMTGGTGICTVTASWPATASYAAASKTLSTTAGKLGTTTSIVNTPATAVVGQTVTVKVTVTGGGPAGPTGTASVTASTGEACTASVTAGTGTCSLTFASAGPRTITALYNGDGNYNISRSAAANEAIGDFAIGISPVSQTLTGGGQAKYTLTLTPLSGFTGTVSLGCSSSPAFPAGYSCSLSSTSVSLNGGTQRVTVTVSTAKGTAGAYTLTFKGTNTFTGGTLVRTVPAKLTTTK